MTVLSCDCKAKRSVTVSVPTKFPIGGKNAQAVESYDCPGQYAYADERQARRYTGRQMEAHEVRGLVWQARSTVRTLRCCTRVRVNGIPMKKYRDDAPVFVVTRAVTRVVSMGVNECITPPRALGAYSFPFSFPFPLSGGLEGRC